MANVKLQDKLVISTDTKFLNIVRGFVSRMVRQSDLPNEDENKIIVAIDEAVTNIIEHAYEMQRNGTITIQIDADDMKFQVAITDSGKRFDPKIITDPDILNHIKNKKKKGLGIFLMRQIMDEVRYMFKDGIQNELVLVKYIKKV